MRPDDGGVEVKEVQRLLMGNGFCASDEEMEWWQYGSTTENAVKTFQACAGLPETGMVDVGTWQALMAKEGLAPPRFDGACAEEDEYCEDMAADQVRSPPPPPRGPPGLFPPGRGR